MAMHIKFVNTAIPNKMHSQNRNSRRVLFSKV